MELIFFIAVITGVCFLLSKVVGPTQEEIKEVEQRRALEKNMICPHCHTQGSVTTRKEKQKAGISGGKATAAVLTCGVSLLGTGLSRKQWVTNANCSNCGATWSF